MSYAATETFANTIAPLMAQKGPYTNGAWTSILSTIYPFPSYLVIPRFRVKSGDTSSKADLVVWDVEKNCAKLVYEGKKVGKSTSTINEADEQLSEYISTLGVEYGVAAVGRTAAVVKKVGGKLVELQWVDGKIVEEEGEHRYDVVDDAAIIEALLKKI
ncbi:hypothetical protein H072_4137 [Dactylellina haptotyla CBS 200.50]|uniref:Type I restriction enzyme R protein N-terminal domain-containing protein n=1 Tax=Dactylellina haptotyla (strain CBS 200.50) TaxID=1284197 RepID=S8BR57_DACHA|nr:hypothetical protein H072_4137 [Dactylellina haptotyla CBS 200.50]